VALRLYHKHSKYEEREHKVKLEKKCEREDKVQATIHCPSLPPPLHHLHYHHHPLTAWPVPVTRTRTVPFNFVLYQTIFYPVVLY
jgi:hypothetical protein